MSNRKYVVVERSYTGRYTALRGVSYPTEAEAQAHIVNNYKERFRDRFHVEWREIKADDAKDRMTCQCCNRPILANKGRIALHGYERPGSGWQTASCYGARYLPWEVSCDAVKSLLEMLDIRLKATIEQRAAVEADLEPVRHTYMVYPRDGRRKFQTTDRFTRETLAALQAEKPEHYTRYGQTQTFDQYKAADLASYDRYIAGLRHDIVEYSNRLKGWKQTHKREGDRWVAL